MVHCDCHAAPPVAIGGQYENIFKTLLNKIKALEIGQSLIGLYADNMYACYTGALTAAQEQEVRYSHMLLV